MVENYFFIQTKTISKLIITTIYIYTHIDSIIERIPFLNHGGKADRTLLLPLSCREKKLRCKRTKNKAAPYHEGILDNK